jgi:hypothetical protein
VVQLPPVSAAAMAVVLSVSAILPIYYHNQPQLTFLPIKLESVVDIGQKNCAYLSLQEDATATTTSIREHIYHVVATQQAPSTPQDE